MNSNRKAAPVTVANFVLYVDEGFFDGTIFHRVIPGFMIQGVNKYQYFDVSIDDLPEMKEIEAVLFTNHYHPEVGEIMMVVGNPETVEEIIGHEIFADKVVNDPAWLYRLIPDFANARRVKRGCISDARAVFITRKCAYMIQVDTDERVVYGPDYQSEQLRKYFEEVGLLDEYRKPPDMNEVIKGLKGGPPDMDPNRIKEAQERPDRDGSESR